MVSPGKYRHFKNKDYEVLCVAYDEVTEEPLVVYKALYGEGRTWVRKLTVFEEIVERDGYKGPRFFKILD